MEQIEVVDDAGRALARWEVEELVTRLVATKWAGMVGDLKAQVALTVRQEINRARGRVD